MHSRVANNKAGNPGFFYFFYSVLHKYIVNIYGLIQSALDLSVRLHRFTTDVYIFSHYLKKHVISLSQYISCFYCAETKRSFKTILMKLYNNFSKIHSLYTSLYPRFNHKKKNVLGTNTSEILRFILEVYFPTKFKTFLKLKLFSVKNLFSFHLYFSPFVYFLFSVLVILFNPLLYFKHFNKQKIPPHYIIIIV